MTAVAHAAAPSAQPPPSRKVIGRYVLYDEFARGGMATLHLGRLHGSAGFARTVAIKRLHANLAGQSEFTAMLIDEARVAARVRHPNVVPTLDVVSSDGELLVVMEYVHGLALSQLLSIAGRTGRPCPPPVALAIVRDLLRGLHAAHEARDETGKLLDLVHRDVSPQNVLIGGDGVARIVDFGVAKAAGRMQDTRTGEIKGKVPYMPPEQLQGETPTRRVDVYGAGIVLWESLTGRRLFSGENEGAIWMRVLNDTVKPPSTFAPAVSRELDKLVLRAISKHPAQRFESAAEMAAAIERVAPLASATEIGAWVESLGSAELHARAALLSSVEHEPSSAGLEVPADTPTTIKRRRKFVAGIGVASVALGVAIALVVSRAREPTPSVAIPEAVAASPGPAVAAALPATTAAAAVETPAAATSAEPESIDLDPVGGNPSAANGAATRPATRGTARRPASGKKEGKDSCDPPFFIDSFGRKQYKEQCL